MIHNFDAVPGPSRESRFSAHGAIGDSIAQPSVAFQQKQQSNLGAAASNGGENLWGPLSKQSSSSSFWGGHQVEADPVPESVQVWRVVFKLRNMNASHWCCSQHQM